MPKYSTWGSVEEMNSTMSVNPILVIICVIGFLYGVGTVTAYNYAQPTAPGFVQFHILANPAQDTVVWVKNDLQNVTFSPEFNFDKSPKVLQNPDFVRLEIPADGVRTEPCGASNYTSYLQNGNGNQIETIHFRCGGGDTTYVTFIGSAISMDVQVQPTVMPTVTETPRIPPTMPTVTTTATPVPTPSWTPVIPPTMPPTPTITATPTKTPTPKPTVTPCPCCHRHKDWWNFWEEDISAACV